jgi:hypothetical protein
MAIYWASDDLRDPDPTGPIPVLPSFSDRGPEQGEQPSDVRPLQSEVCLEPLAPLDLNRELVGDVALGLTIGNFVWHAVNGIERQRKIAK